MRILKIVLVGAVLAAIAGTGLYLLAPARFVGLALYVERAAAGLGSHSVEIDGFRVAYLDSGSSREPLILVHGFGGEKDNWLRVGRLLKPYYRVIAPDLPGFGQSTAPIGVTYGVQDHVKRLHAFVASLGLSRAHFGGNSMGGTTVAAYAIAYPAEVASLWLISNGGIASAPKSELRQRIDRGEPHPLLPADAAQFREMLGFAMSRPPFVPDAMIDVLAQRAVAARALRAKQYRDLMDESLALEDSLAGLQIPTHVLWGDDDRLLHVGAAQIIGELMPNATVTVLQGIGHLPMLEAPEATAEDYLRFRGRLRGNPTPVVE